jgi:flavin reductase (DIM6/NTAB) family NADH-FMN oxidoreductase RutF
MDINNENSWIDVLGKIPSGLFVLTSRHVVQKAGNQKSADQQVGDPATVTINTGKHDAGILETGMLASWVMQAGFEPPMLSIAVRKDRYLAEWLEAKSPCVLNLLAEGQKKYLSHFGRGFAATEPAFVGLEIERDSRQVPILAEALGHLECEPRQHVDSGDHRIFLVEIVGGRLRSAEAAPAVHIRKSGLKY